MFSIANLLDKAKASAEIESDYRLSKLIGITHSVVSSYRLKKSMPNEKILAQLCDLSGDDPGVIAAQIQAERAQSEEGKKLWLDIAKRLSRGLARSYQDDAARVSAQLSRILRIADTGAANDPPDSRPGCFLPAP